MLESESDKKQIGVVKSARNGRSRGICFPKELRESDEFPTGESTHYKLLKTDDGIEVVPVE